MFKNKDVVFIPSDEISKKKDGIRISEKEVFIPACPEPTDSKLKDFKNMKFRKRSYYFSEGVAFSKNNY